MESPSSDFHIVMLTCLVRVLSARFSTVLRFCLGVIIVVLLKYEFNVLLVVGGIEPAYLSVCFCFRVSKLCRRSEVIFCGCGVGIKERPCVKRECSPNLVLYLRY